MDALRRVKIPAALGRMSSHVVTVELDFASGLQSRDDVAFGGGAGGEAQSELTAVPIRHDEEAQAQTRALSRASCAPARSRLRVATAEEGPASLWIVRDESATEAYGEALGARGGRARARRRRCLSRRPTRSASSGRARESFRAGVPTALFPSARRLDPRGRRPRRSCSRTSRIRSPKGSSRCTPTPSRWPGSTRSRASAAARSCSCSAAVAADVEHVQAGGRQALPRAAPRSPLRLVARGPAARELPLGRGRGRRDALGTCARLTPAFATRLDTQRILWVEGALPPAGDSACRRRRRSIELVR